MPSPTHQPPKTLTLLRALRNVGLTATERVVMNELVLRGKQSKGFLSFILMQRLTKDTGLGESTVRRCLRSLEDGGYLAVTPRRGRSSIYHPNWSSIMAKAEAVREAEFPQPKFAEPRFANPAPDPHEADDTDFLDEYEENQPTPGVPEEEVDEVFGTLSALWDHPSIETPIFRTHLRRCVQTAGGPDQAIAWLVRANNDPRTMDRIRSARDLGKYLITCFADWAGSGKEQN